MFRRAILGAGLLGLLVLTSGCAGIISQDSTGITTTPSDNTPSLPEEDIIRYSDLSNEGKEFFKQVLENDTVVAPPPLAPSEFSPEEQRYITYNGTQYQLTWEKKGLVGKNSIGLTAQSNHSSDARNDSVINYRNLSDTGQRIFTEILNQSGKSYWDSELPNSYHHYDFIKHNGVYYRVSITVADYQQWEISISEMNNSS